MITLITGDPSSGRSTIAIEITRGKKSVWLHEGSLGSCFCFNVVHSDTEFIVIDEVNDIDAAYVFINEELEIQRPSKKTEIIKMPDVILISRNLSSEDFPDIDLHVIELKKD